jgi:hypothetical protein
MVLGQVNVLRTQPAGREGKKYDGKNRYVQSHDADVDLAGEKPNIFIIVYQLVANNSSEQDIPSGLTAKTVLKD